MLLLSAFQTHVTSLHLPSRDDIIVGTTVANRNHLDLEGIMGFFANTLVRSASI